MKITFKELLKDFHADNISDRSDKYWLHRCIMQSATGDDIKLAKEKGDSYEVMLLINGVEREPVMLNDLIENIEKHIDREAEILLRKKIKETLDKLHSRMSTLHEIMTDAGHEIMREYGLHPEDYKD